MFSIEFYTTESSHGITGSRLAATGSRFAATGSRITIILNTNCGVDCGGNCGGDCGVIVDVTFRKARRLTFLKNK